jgi:UDP-D-galactose:(glucosyl)LPS alpha-1,6-D-galactosyltransferase
MMARAETATFLYVGRLTYNDQKRVNDILQAVSRLKGDFKVKIVGEAPSGRPEDRGQLMALANDLGLQDRLEWFGWQADPWGVAGSGSALILASAHEGFPMILLEALSRGLPCISSDCKSGPSEIIEVGKNGWLYPVADVDRLAVLMQRVVDSPGILPEPYSVRETARKFSAESVAERARRALLSVMKN